MKLSKTIFLDAAAPIVVGIFAEAKVLMSSFEKIIEPGRANSETPRGSRFPVRAIPETDQRFRH